MNNERVVMIDNTICGFIVGCLVSMIIIIISGENNCCKIATCVN